MVHNKSLDKYDLIAALLRDVQTRHREVFNTRALRLTLKYVNRRLDSEGISFLTKTLPRLGKAFDKALSGDTPLNAQSLRFTAYRKGSLPRFLGELFSTVLAQDGTLLQRPCVESVAVIRQITYAFYKYKLPYSDEQEQLVLQKFAKTEEELAALQPTFREIEVGYEAEKQKRLKPSTSVLDVAHCTRIAKLLLQKLFSNFDPKDIIPRHGPGAVSTKEKLWDKFRWKNVSKRITDVYPFDAYFCASQGEVCDKYRDFNRVTDMDLSAQVLLVPKDSRGPRLISCEPVDFQWVQQGLGRAIIELVEKHWITKFNVHFTDQMPNRFGAVLGSKYGTYATLDLNEASDRVSLSLVRLLFPEHVYTYLESCRSLSTKLPNGKVLPLQKFAPMGSALCFPILALTIWAILTAGAPDRDTRESILVYGDDVIVPTTYVANAIGYLESFGLKVNRDKSCTSGLFRESCGMDAFYGADVTPVRFRTVWTESPSPESYSSWIAYANQFWNKGYYNTYWLIADSLLDLYGPIPDEDMNLSCPSLCCVPLHQRPKRRRQNPHGLQKLEYSVLDVKTPKQYREIDGWSMLLRYFTEACTARPSSDFERDAKPPSPFEEREAFSVRLYTKRRVSVLTRCWR